MRVFIVVLVGFLGMGTRAQTIRIKLVNGKSGRPMANKCVNVGIDHLGHMLAIPTDEEGIASLRFTDKDAEVNTEKAWHECGDFGVINPVVKHAESIRIDADYVSCVRRVPKHSWMVSMTFPIAKVVQSGIVGENVCGKAKVSPEPGEVVLFARPPTLWEKLIYIP